MLATNPTVRIPDPVEAGTGSQEIDVPVRSRRYRTMVCDARPHTARPQGAAYVDVETASKPQETELAYLDLPLPRAEKD
jgi:hypothetical protein